MAEGILCLQLLDLRGAAPHHVRDNQLEEEVNHLRGYRKVDELVPQPVTVDVEALGLDVHLVMMVGERLDCKRKNVKMRNDDAGERDVDEGGQCYSHVRRHKIHDEALLGESCFVRAIGFVVLVIGESHGRLVQDARQDGHDGRQNAGGEVYLQNQLAPSMRIWLTK